MYLGQCMQMQSDISSSSGKDNTNLVPYRQCKLTELLFTNTLASAQNHNHNGNSRTKSTQKSIMIVTADAWGDFNATSQMLRYSALAKEVTVPRIPSVSQTILGVGVTTNTTAVPSKGTGRASPQQQTQAHISIELENALAELSRLREELEVTNMMLQEETQRRKAAEASWRATEARMEDIEAEVREEMFEENEARMIQERQRWRMAMEDEVEARERLVDGKMSVFAKTIDVDGIGENKENMSFGAGGDEGWERMEQLEEENAGLRSRLERLERERGLRSPSKKIRVLKARKWEGDGMGISESP